MLCMQLSTYYNVTIFVVYNYVFLGVELVSSFDLGSVCVRGIATNTCIYIQFSINHPFTQHTTNISNCPNWILLLIAYSGVYCEGGEEDK